jgi:hypothetical protein
MATPPRSQILLKWLTDLKLAWILVLCCIGWFLGAGCASLGTLKDNYDHITGFYGDDKNITMAERYFVGKRNEEMLKLFSEERPYRSGKITPQRCMSLSGGGLRSATYSLGVMKALSEHNLLDNLDLISAVSGGAYALGWYLHHLPQLEGESKLLFTQEYISRIVAARDPWGLFTNIFIPALQLPLSLLNSVLFILDADPRYPPGEINLSSIYEHSLLKTYAPMSFDQGTIEQLGGYVRERRLPGFIFNMTIQDSESERLSAHGKIFEVTTAGVSSEFNGFRPYGEMKWQEDFARMSVLGVLAISGAATSKPYQGCVAHSIFDRCPWQKFWAYLRMYTGMTFGKTILGLQDGEADRHVYYFLSDGGHSENLGAFSLIRRHCKDIIIVDAEEDKNYVFEGYIILRSLVKNRLDASLDVEPIDERLKQHDTCTNDIRGKRICPDPTSSWTLSSMSGKVEQLPLVENGVLDTEPLSITYLKLSVNRDQLSFVSTARFDADGCVKSPSDLVSPELYYTSNLIKLARQDDQFPMYGTLNQWLSRERREALMDLGYATMKDVLCRKPRSHTVD